MAGYDTVSELRIDALTRAGEDATDTAGDYYARAGRYAVRAAHEIENKHPFLWSRAYPPGALRTTDDVAIATCTVTGGSTGVSALSPAPGGSVTYLNRKIVFAGVAGFWRVAAHTAGATSLTLDTAYDGADSAAQAATVYQDEYALTTGVRHLLEMFVSESGAPIIQKPEEWLRQQFPEPGSPGWPPTHFARIDAIRVRFSHYPNVARRIEYGYTVMGDDIDTGTIRVPSGWRHVIADGILYFLLHDKNDSKRTEAGALFGLEVEQMVADDLRMRAPLMGPQRPDPGPYA